MFASLKTKLNNGQVRSVLNANFAFNLSLSSFGSHLINRNVSPVETCASFALRNDQPFGSGNSDKTRAWRNSSIAASLIDSEYGSDIDQPPAKNNLCVKLKLNSVDHDRINITCDPLSVVAQDVLNYELLQLILLTAAEHR
jgi:hypothetical protein